ncbi:Dolichyl-diphosphooligosaccharide-protein glycosyltransferase subunit dad1 [Geranomyces variabilis]|nr:DAD family-domain-containing protein [Geranomyces variabilis]KAJ3137747.1 Dolichyl-diphosphooligosaccharide-protein glycosyltransferase subunit dad1 [Geranomyces variabilis]KAJ3147193.1 Dolichyl-diphosphooligosaccharide-protein glycosyltransferase subunit dad1 [Geranomyces variabilis]KAJ3171603.1 Dolichyl-diphosphooligosaccharide-protein glycosyltransferase subunit dad1 [Geranomyces variabilis]
MAKSVHNTQASSAAAVQQSAQKVSKAAATQAFLVKRLLNSYTANTPQSIKLIDAYLLFVMLTGIIQFVYVILAGTYPYNSFLAGFGASVGSFVLAANLRMQINPQNKAELNISQERAFADFAFSSIVLFGFVVNFLG